MPQKKKALVMSADYTTLANISEKAKMVGIYQPDVYLGTSAGALIGLFVPIREYTALDHLIGDYTEHYRHEEGIFRFITKILGLHPTLKSLVEQHYTRSLHAELVENQKPVIVGVVNLTTGDIEYFDLSTMSYEKTVLVVLASIQQPYERPVQILNHHYADASLFVQNHVVHVMDMGMDEIDVLLPRLRNPLPSTPWKPTTSLSIVERLFSLLRNFRPDFQDYSVMTIANARQIITRLRYLDDTVD